MKEAEGVLLFFPLSPNTSFNSAVSRSWRRTGPVAQGGENPSDSSGFSEYHLPLSFSLLPSLWPFALHAQYSLSWVISFCRDQVKTFKFAPSLERAQQKTLAPRADSTGLESGHSPIDTEGREGTGSAGTVTAGFMLQRQKCWKEQRMDHGARA